MDARGEPPKQLRVRSVGTKLSEAEYAQCERTAERRGLTLGEWCRQALLEAAEGPAQAPEVEAILGEILALRKEAAQLVTEYETGQLSKHEFCRTHGLAISTLDAYRSGRRLGLRNGKTSPPRWVAVEVQDAPPQTTAAGSGLAVVLAQGRRIEVMRGFDAATLAQLLTVLERG